MYGIELGALADVTAPVLLTTGAASPALFEAALERLAATLPRAERHRFPEAGHLPHITHPDEYLDALTDFASRIARHHTAAVPTAAP
jgi:pimeloyl-ACP methyl ester carboxylesterase